MKYLLRKINITSVVFIFLWYIIKNVKNIDLFKNIRYNQAIGFLIFIKERMGIIMDKRKRLAIFSIIFVLVIFLYYISRGFNGIVETILVSISCFLFSFVIEDVLHFYIMKKQDKLRALSFSLPLKVMKVLLVLMYSFQVYNSFREEIVISLFISSFILAIAYAYVRGSYIGETYLVAKGRFIKLSDINQTKKEEISGLNANMDYVEYIVEFKNNRKFKFTITRSFFPEDLEKNLDKKILVI